VNEADLARGLVQNRVGLDKNLSRLLVLEHDIPDLDGPVVRVNGGHIVVELGTGLDIACGLVDMQLLQILADGWRGMVSGVC